MITITIAVLFNVWIALKCANTDYNKIIKDIVIHLEDKFSRSMWIAIGNTAFASYISYNMVAYNRMFWLLLMFQTVFWIVFDLRLNLLRGKSIWYTSNDNVDSEDSIFDSIFHIFPYPHSGRVQYLVKVIILVGSFYLAVR